MTNIKFFKNSNGDIVKYILKGHTGFEESGKDIVCSAVSVLAITGANSLNEVCNINIKVNMEDGYLEVLIPEDINTEKRDKANVVIETILVGIKSTMESYPDYITLEYGEVE
ncbi:MAG: ribosomal-processing cysteine protease Prp [Firmicutes bacterium]|nr:ribosomal-processing cysteine protease Prp [Bacillota bacterium]